MLRIFHQGINTNNILVIYLKDLFVWLQDIKDFLLRFDIYDFYNPEWKLTMLSSTTGANKCRRFIATPKALTSAEGTEQRRGGQSAPKASSSAKGTNKRRRRYLN